MTDPTDDLLDQIIAEAATIAKRVSGKKSHEQKRELERIVEESEYLPTRMVALLNRITCACCGSKRLELDGIFEDRKHRRLQQSHWVKQPMLPLDTGLPRHLEYREVAVAFCLDCAGLQTYTER
jgi:hypothetical protein